MAQHNIAAPTYPASGSSGWDSFVVALFNSLITATNDTDSLNDARKGKLTDRGAWAASTAYAVGDEVTYQARRYACPVAFTSTTTFSAANWVDQGVMTVTINGSGPSTAGDFTVAGGTASIPHQGTRFLVGQAYSSSMDYGTPSNISPTLSRMLLRRWIAGRALPTGTNLIASWFQNAAIASSFFRPVVYKINPADLSLTLVVDFGQVDTSAGAGVIKATAATATLADIAVSDMLAVGGAGQGAVPTVQGSAGFDSWLPAGTAGPATGARSQGLYLDGVTGAAPSTVPALGATGGVVIQQSGTASIPVVYLTAQS